MPTPRPTPAQSAHPTRLRVLVVDDSPFMQRRMIELLERDGDLEIVGTAGDGVDAIRRAVELRPDVITMDIHMPRMDGLLAIKHIMHTRPRPIMVVSSFVRSGSAAAIAALEHGAVDLVVLIGCSTGGPAALLQLVRQWRGCALPAIVVAQHLPAEFTAELALQMAGHLDGMPRAVREAGQASQVLPLSEIGRALAAAPLSLLSP